MILAQHCDLCDHQKKSLKVGTTCGLTNQKPDFDITCHKIAMNDKFLKKLEEANLYLKKTSRYRNSVYLTFSFLILVGLLFILFSSTWAEWTYSRTYFLYYKIGAIGLGISIITIAFFKLINFRKELRIAAHKKNAIDSLIENYGIKYRSNFNFQEKNHGIQKIEVILEFENWNKKSTCTTYISDN